MELGSSDVNVEVTITFVCMADMLVQLCRNAFDRFENIEKYILWVLSKANNTFSFANFFKQFNTIKNSVFSFDTAIQFEVGLIQWIQRQNVLFFNFIQQTA